MYAVDQRRGQRILDRKGPWFPPCALSPERLAEIEMRNIDRRRRLNASPLVGKGPSLCHCRRRSAGLTLDGQARSLTSRRNSPADVYITRHRFKSRSQARCQTQRSLQLQTAHACLFAAREESRDGRGSVFGDSHLDAGSRPPFLDLSLAISIWPPLLSDHRACRNLGLTA